MIFKEKEREKLFSQIRLSIGEPVRDYSDWVTDDVIEKQIEIAHEDYMSYVNNWLINQQWSSLEGLSLTDSDFIQGLTTKSLNFEKSFAAAYGKQTGMSTLGDWELKSDYIVVSANTQRYLIPSGREINEVLWYTPAQIATNILDPIGMNGGWFGAPSGWYYGNTPAQAMLPSFSLLLSTMDRMEKKKIIQSELSYRIVGGPNKQKWLFLYPIPGSRDEITGIHGKTINGSKVWYFYYDTNEQGRDKCLEENDDTIKLPTDVPMAIKKWENINDSTKNKVRRLTTALVHKFLATIWAKTSGKVLLPDGKEINIDYRFFLDEAKNEREAILTELKEELDSLSYDKIMEKKASIARNLNEVLSYAPSRINMIWK